VVDLKSLDNVALILMLVVPGLIATFVRAQFITGKTTSHADAALSYLVLSVIYYAVVLPALTSLFPSGLASFRSTWAWFLVLFVGPAFLGLLLGIEAQKQLTRRFLQWCCLNPVHVMPTAWDWKFATAPEQWLLVVLKDGTQFAGYWGGQSFGSSDPKERDLYIERVYDIDDDNNWHPRENGVLIASGEIRTIEFWPCNR
jgi:hypothetical protein